MSTDGNTTPYPNAGEVFGFAGSIAVTVIAVLYVLWASLPDETLVALGVEWYPDREWALLIPAWSLVLILTIYFAYISLALYGTPPLDSLRTITDSHANVPCLRTPSRSYPPPSLSHQAPPSLEGYDDEIHDLPIGAVSRAMYFATS